MRVLFCTLPATGHFFPLVPVALAVRAAGHEVLFGSCGEAAAVARAGLPMADLAPGTTLKTLFAEFHRRHEAVNQRIAAGDRSAELEGVHFGTFSDWLADAAVALAAEWRPDLVVYERMAPFGLLAATVLGVPAIRHDLGLCPGERAGQLRHLAPAIRRHGRTELADHGPWLDIAPPSLARSARDGWLMRPLPYDDGGPLPEWSRRPARRARIAITLGTIVPRMQGIGVVRHLLALAPETDADFVLAMEPRDAEKLGPLPGNVRAGGWLPMSGLLAVCSAVIHHGGSGTMYAAIGAGVPQWVLPDGASDRHVNAEALAARGIGIADRISATALERLVTDRDLRAAAQEVRAELASMPAPAELVPRFAALVG